MKIRLDSARNEPFRWEETVSIAGAAVGLGPESELSPISVRGSLSRVGSDLLLEANLQFQLTVPCDRCTAPVRADVASTLQLVVAPGKSAGHEDGEHELSEDDFGVLAVSGPGLETEPLIAEQVELELPAHPLCRPDCAGLCPICGGDRNLVECGCAAAEFDPRWVALATMRKKLGKRG